MSPRTAYHARECAQRRFAADNADLSAPGLVFWFADEEAASKTSYPPSPFRWIDSQQEAEDLVQEAKANAAQS